MIEPVAYWTPLISGLSAFVVLLLRTIELLEKKKEVIILMENLPYLLKLLTKFIIYALSLIIPNVIIIWYFFYLAGISPDRLSEVNFFWAVVAEPTIGVSFYAYAWGKWIYPRLQHIVGVLKPQQKPRHSSRTHNESSKSGGKK